MITVEERDRVRDRVLEMAIADQPVIAGAAIGFTRVRRSDRWSDLDLIFGVADGVPMVEVLTEQVSERASDRPGNRSPPFGVAVAVPDVGLSLARDNNECAQEGATTWTPSLRRRLR